MKPPEQIATRTRRPQRGFVATLSGLLRATGTGAPSCTAGAAEPSQAGRSLCSTGHILSPSSTGRILSPNKRVGGRGGPGRSLRKPVGIRAFAVLAVTGCSLLLGVSSAYASLGISEFAFSANEAPPAGSEQGARGAVDVRAGSHPWSLTTAFKMNRVELEPGFFLTGGDLRDVHVSLPPGLIGDPNVVPRCTSHQFNTQGFRLQFGLSGADCPNNTQVGVAAVELENENGIYVLELGIYNLVPRPGVAAEFGFNPLGVPVILTPTVRTGSDYGLTVSSVNTSQAQVVFGVKTTFWGVPADPSHDAYRGECLLGEFGLSNGSCPDGEAPAPFLTLPTRCSPEGLSASVQADSWQEPGALTESGQPMLSDPRWKTAHVQGPVLSGCERLAFNAADPAFSIAPDSFSADTPVGLTAEVKMDQPGLTSPDGTAAATLQNTRVTLPEGVTINPGQAAGLAACQAPESAVGTEGVPSCPLASRVGTVQIATPLLEDKLEGNVYVLQSNPPHLRLLVAASGDGVNLKLVGDVELDPATGRLVTTFDETPPLPFTDFKLSFSGGARAALVTPTRCGSYQTLADFTPWTSPLEQDALESSVFPIDSGPAGSGCSSSLPFAPEMVAGATTDQAGGFTDFSLQLTRGDGQQRISTLQFKTPEGLLGMISKVPLCGEPQASLGECPAASQIGHTVVEAGPGPYPLVVPQPGQPPAPIYLTGGYKGAPYGLSIVVPLVVGPFVLQTQVVRAKIDVDPHTARLTITTDPIPSIIDGIPSDVRSINAVIDRPQFMFNPTNCSPMTFEGTATSTEGTPAALASDFQVGSCRSLTFKPDFKVSTSGHTSKQNGASLDAKVVYPSVAPGANQASSQSNISYVKVDLPKQLPSRLTTLQKACLAAVFKANPANCPAGSIVGIARASTPVLPVGLTGPVYFVSNGGEAFPNLVIVLQGYGVTVDLIGDTFISKAGITSSTFKQVPDVPISSFELYLPEGRYSALGANANLCKSKLSMPTEFVAQNGLTIHQATKIAVTGCGAKPARKTTKASKALRARRARARRGGRS